MGPAKSSVFVPERTAVFCEGKKIRAAVYDRNSLRSGRKYSGAAVVTEYSATTFVPPGAQFWLDKTASLVIQMLGT